MQISSLMKAYAAPSGAWLAMDTGTTVYNTTIEQFRMFMRGAFYVSDGTLFTVNYQSDSGDNYVTVPASVKIVSMYNGSGDHNVVCIGREPFTLTSYKTSGGSVIVESTATSNAYSYFGITYYYARSRWYSPAPVVTIPSNRYTNLIPDAFRIATTGVHNTD